MFKFCTALARLFILKASWKLHSPLKKRVHLLITDIEPICIEHVSHQIIIIILIAWSICFMLEKQWCSLRCSLVKAVAHSAPSVLLYSDWTGIINREINWNAGVNTRLCMSYPLYCQSFLPCPWVQRLRLIKDWVWFTQNHQGRGDRELCDYWTLPSVLLIQQCAAVTQ